MKRRREHQKTLGRVTLNEVRRARYNGHVADSMKPFATEAEIELTDLLMHLGGKASTTEDLIARDLARLGMLLRALLMVWLRTPGDLAVAKTITNMVGQRRASLLALGLQR